MNIIYTSSTYIRHKAISVFASVSLCIPLASGSSVKDSFIPQEGIAVLDMTSRNSGESEENGDYSRQLYSATYMCDIAGNPYSVTADIDEAMRDKVILLSSDITASSFTVDELQSLIGWVKEGGVLVSPAIRSVSTSKSPLLSELFGIDATSLPPRSKENIRIN